MIWWTSQPSRARSERLAIAELGEESVWLRDLVWRLTPEGRLCADFGIEHHGDVLPFTLTYPHFFPEMPPQVTPRDKVRLSNHQYGPGGELCLEFRPDNWEPSFTGSMMLQSAKRLLSGEQPSPGTAAEVASEHRTTVGQDVRTATMRFVLSNEARTALLAVPMLKVADADISEHQVAGHWLAYAFRVADGDVVHFDAKGLIPPFRTRKGYFVRLGPDLKRHVRATYEFVEILLANVHRDDAKARVAESMDEVVLLVECDGDFKLMSVAPGAGKRFVHDYKTVSAPVSHGARLPTEYGRLARASVAIVGCGSVGSKLAAMLARAGVGSFVLIDGDVMFADNMVRNDLEWRSVGLNKPDAVGDRIRKILPAANVLKRRLDLGGQESSDSTEATLVAIGKCDVIVDATADPQAFNLCGAVARAERKPFAWAEVFGGGIGGLVVRLRPDVEPVPHAARRQILDWCTARGVPPPGATGDQYGLALSDDGPPLVADDADVSIIAAHMARMVIDLLVREDTLFPQAAYAVGLKPGWIFEAPFDTWPIGLQPEGPWGPPGDDELADELSAMVTEFFPAAEGRGG